MGEEEEGGEAKQGGHEEDEDDGEYGGSEGVLSAEDSDTNTARQARANGLGPGPSDMGDIAEGGEEGENGGGGVAFDELLDQGFVVETKEEGSGKRRPREGDTVQVKVETYVSLVFCVLA